MSDNETHVHTLIAKAADCCKTLDYDAAMRYSQAALNAAHALQVLAATRRDYPEQPF